MFSALHALTSGNAPPPQRGGPLEHLLLGQRRSDVLVEAPDTATVALADSLLEAVIAHWGALGTTSPQGLRESFLQRTGVISSDASSQQVRLEVEARPYDMLLDKLPWTVSPVRLRWMKAPIFVSWRGMSGDG